MKRLAWNRRLLFAGLFCLALPPVVGCDADAWGSRHNAKATGYAAVENGMSEAQVRKHMGEPRSRSNINLEGAQPALVLRYMGQNQLIHVTLVNGKVIGKEKI